MRILLVEDHPLFRDGFAAMLAHHRADWRLDAAGSAAAAMAALDDAHDLIIVDIHLPGTDGFETVRQLAARAPQTPRVMISGREDDAAPRRSRDCGASGFIAKAWEPERIVATLERVLAGGSGFDAARGGPATLTARQLEVLALLGEGHSNKAIERRLDIAPRTVRAHLTDIFAALDADGRLQATLRARELGLIA